MERQAPEDEEDWPEDEADWPDEAEEGWDPNDPSHPDHDLSEAAGYGARDYRDGQMFPSQTFVVIVSLLLLAALAAPFILRLLR